MPSEQLPDTWYTGKDAIPIKISDMTDIHLHNAYKYVMRKSGMSSPYLKAFTKEMSRRELIKPKPFGIEERELDI